MATVEDKFKEKKLDIDKIKAPEDLEDKLRFALNNKRKKKKVQIWWAAAIILIIIGSYSFDAIAYYGKKIMGYDRITEGNLSKVNELGKGQKINQRVTFANGVTATVDGLFFDDNKLVLLYKLEGDINKSEIGMPRFELKGIGSYKSKSGQGIQVAENTWAMVNDFEPPAFYEKWMKLEINYLGKNYNEIKEIKFMLDRNLALNHVIKQDINKKIDVEGVQVTFDSISASPLEVNIKGSFKKKVDNRKSPDYNSHLTFDLYINNKKFTYRGSGMSSNNDQNFEFENNFDGISEKIDSIKIDNIRIIESKDVDKQIAVNYETKNISFPLGSTSINIKEITYDGEFTYVKLETPKNVEVPIGLLMGNNSFELVSSEFKNMGQSDLWIHKFNGKGEGMEIGIKTVDYVKKSSQWFNIPVN